MEKKQKNKKEEKNRKNICKTYMQAVA